LYFDSSIPVPEPNYFDLFIIYWLVTVRNKVDNLQKSFLCPGSKFAAEKCARFCGQD